MTHSDLWSSHLVIWWPPNCGVFDAICWPRYMWLQGHACPSKRVVPLETSQLHREYAMLLLINESERGNHCPCDGYGIRRGIAPSNSYTSFASFPANHLRTRQQESSLHSANPNVAQYRRPTPRPCRHRRRLSSQNSLRPWMRHVSLSTLPYRSCNSLSVGRPFYSETSVVLKNNAYSVF